jgi:hypothetical protein
MYFPDFSLKSFSVFSLKDWMDYIFFIFFTEKISHVIFMEAFSHKPTSTIPIYEFDLII